MDEDICAIGSGPFKVEVDLMQPIDPEKKPAVHATPLNHIGLWIDDLPVAVEWLTAQGVRFAPGGIRKGAAGFDITFLHPKANEEFPIAGEGVLIELVQAPPEVVSAFARLAAQPGLKPADRGRKAPQAVGLQGFFCACLCRRAWFTRRSCSSWSGSPAPRTRPQSPAACTALRQVPLLQSRRACRAPGSGQRPP